MAQTSKTPAVQAGASRDSLGSNSRVRDSLAARQTQFLIAACNINPERAAMLAALVFAGGAHG